MIEPRTSANAGHPDSLRPALKEWAVAVRALREGRQILLLRKGGILDADGEFSVEARDVLLFPTYLHEDEQKSSLQPCYGAWAEEETRRRPAADVVRIDAWARITDIFRVTNFQALYRLSSQHIYSDSFLKYRIENEPHKPLHALFLRAYDLAAPVTVPMEPDYYGCKSYISLTDAISTAGSRPALSDHTYEERVRVLRERLAGDSPIA
jgi:hypothetical protein